MLKVLFFVAYSAVSVSVLRAGISDTSRLKVIATRRNGVSIRGMSMILRSLRDDLDDVTLLDLI